MQPVFDNRYSDCDLEYNQKSLHAVRFLLSLKTFLLTIPLGLNVNDGFCSPQNLYHALLKPSHQIAHRGGDGN
jgi:hypothetical protein